MRKMLSLVASTSGIVAALDLSSKRHRATHFKRRNTETNDTKTEHQKYFKRENLFFRASICCVYIWTVASKRTNTISCWKMNYVNKPNAHIFKKHTFLTLNYKNMAQGKIPLIISLHSILYTTSAHETMNENKMKRKKNRPIHRQNIRNKSIIKWWNKCKRANSWNDRAKMTTWIDTSTKVYHCQCCRQASDLNRTF